MACRFRIKSALKEFGEQNICHSATAWINGELVDRDLPKLTPAECQALARQ